MWCGQQFRFQTLFSVLPSNAIHLHVEKTVTKMAKKKIKHRTECELRECEKNVVHTHSHSKQDNGHGRALGACSVRFFLPFISLNETRGTGRRL